MKDYKKIILDAVYPPRCPCCGGIIDSTDRKELYEGKPSYKNYVHRECFPKLHFITENTCERCGIIIKEGKRFCETCLERERLFDAGKAAFLYEEPVRGALAGIKYSHRKEYCDFFSYAVYERLCEWIKSLKVSVIVPVPVHRKRLRARGYNQAEVIARGLSRYTGIPLLCGAVVRNRNTAAQKDLTPVERKKNITGAFSANGRFKEGTGVLLVDDIYTTGSTAETIASVLKKECGAKRVYVLCAATSYEREKNKV